MTRITQSRPAARPTAQTAPSKPATPPKTAAAGWNAKTQSPTAQARALSAHLKSPEGAKQAARIIDTIAKKSELARGLNWEAGNITSVKPLGAGTFEVNVTLEVLKGKGVQKNYFNAIVNAQGKVLDVPQG